MMSNGNELSEERSSPEMIISSDDTNTSKSSDSSPNSDMSNLSQDGSALGMVARTQDETAATPESPLISGTTSKSYNVKLAELLPREIPPATLMAVDCFEKLVTTAVTEKIKLYCSQEAKVSAVIVDLSFPKSYADLLKNNRSLIAVIIKQIFTFIETTAESRLILPEVGIDTLLYLCTQENILKDITQCTSIQVHFSAESWDEIQNNIREVISYLTMRVSPTSINCIPSKNLPFKTSRNHIRNLRDQLITLSSEFAGIQHLTYGDHIIIGENNNLDPDSSNGDTPPRKKIKKRTKLKLLSVPGNRIKNSLFTFDSLQCHLQGEPIAAYSYWQLEKVHKNGNTGVGTTVAIVDSGIDPAHPSFENKGNIKFFEDYSGDPNLNPDAISHGTLCAGIACGNHCPQNPECPQGVAPGAKLAIYKIVLNGESHGTARWHSVLKALEDINGRSDIDVVSLSLGSLQFIPEIAHAITTLVNKNIIVVCAASNHGYKFSQPICYPARLGHTLCIGSHGLHGKPSSFSPVGQQIDFLAPGENIIGPASGSNSIKCDSGTSYATPAVAGLICLILGFIKQQCPGHLLHFKNQWVMKEILREISISPGKHSDDSGFGALNPLRFFEQPGRVLDSVLTDVIVRPNDLNSIQS